MSKIDRLIDRQIGRDVCSTCRRACSEEALLVGLLLPPLLEVESGCLRVDGAAGAAAGCLLLPDRAEPPPACCCFFCCL